MILRVKLKFQCAIKCLLHLILTHLLKLPRGEDSEHPLTKLVSNTNYLHLFLLLLDVSYNFFFHPTDDSCQQWLNMTNKKLTSPYHPWFVTDGCEWLITAPEGHIIALEFEKFTVSFRKEYCKVFAKKLTPK